MPESRPWPLPPPRTQATPNLRLITTPREVPRLQVLTKQRATRPAGRSS